jgi:hypothetical protein
MEATKIPAFVSERFVITIETASDRRKVFQILFRKTDGSLFVSFPYYKHTRGLLSLATLKANTPYPTSLSLVEGGKVTSHKVKYSHHPDGRVHFSQDRKIFTKVRKQSVALEEAEGHIFTIQLQGLGDFKELSATERGPLLSPKKTILNYRFAAEPPEAIKFVGRWHNRESLHAIAEQVGAKPWFILPSSDGSNDIGMIIADPFITSGQECYLLLSCRAIPQLDKDRYSTLTFLGGFDPRHIARDGTKNTSFLTLMYPSSESYEELEKQIGTVDYVRPDRK